MSQPLLKILVFDFDGTLTLEGAEIPGVTRLALERIKKSNLATLGIISGRVLNFLKDENAKQSNLFSFLVAENGAVSFFVDSDKTQILGEDWALKAKEVFANVDFPIRFGTVMAGTSVQYLREVQEILRRSNLDAKLVLNKGSLMVLPPNVDKGTGVAATIEHFGSTSKIHLTCFGDGENDLALFAPADLGVAVSNSVDSLKKIADVVTQKPGGLGVAEYLAKTFFGE